MAMQQTIGASSSSSSSKKYDVFISFRGEDTRTKFTSHLYNALNKKALTFIDENELQKGDEISSALIKAIEEAYASVVIFSQDYASSKWCLNELVKILECKKDQGQIVVPVFYEVDPSHVRNQKGCYKKAFEKYEREFKHDKDKLQKWRNALTEAANLSGWHFQNDSVIMIVHDERLDEVFRDGLASNLFRNESNFIKDIVEDVLKKLNHTHPFEVTEKLFGIEKKNEEVESLMEIGSNDVKTLGLWGMGGIGKTTLTKVVYAKLSSQYERRCFIENVREESTRCGLRGIRDKLFSTLLELRLDAPYVETPIFIRKLACEKSFIVFDDVATMEQAENLNIVNKYLGPGSRVIVTTRDKQICAQFDECEIYEVKGLEYNESLELLCWSAFREKHPKKGYEELSDIAVSYCRGNPLAIKVLGANFGKKSKQVWESELEKLKMIPNRRIYDVLKLSFDDLDRTQQDIFLDLACFSTFIYECSQYYLTILFDACKFFAVSGVEVLLDKALIYVSYDDCSHIRKITMHHLLEEMGREIVRKESPKDLGRRSRLWDPEEVCDVLKYNKGSELVQAIYFNISKIENVYLNSDSFKSMINLRYLHIYHRRTPYEKKYYNIVHFPEGLEWLPDKLRHLFWDSFPLESLPSSFCAERLVKLTMQCSKLKKLWDGIQKLGNLMTINLDGSEDLIEIPDLSLAPKLEEVSLRNCVSLFQLHPSIFTAPKLKNLFLNGCKKIESLKTNIHLKSLEILGLSDCSSLVEISVTSGEMRFLWLRGTAIHEFPSSMWLNSKLLDLNLSGCKKLKSLPKLPTSLQSLTAFNCTCLDTNSILGSILHRLHVNYDHEPKSFYLPVPGAQVPYEFDYRTTETSIVIPPIPKYDLCCFFICIIISEGLHFQSHTAIYCTIYENKKVVHQGLLAVVEPVGTLISDHVLLVNLLDYDFKMVEEGSERGGDCYNHSLEFKFEWHGVDGEIKTSTEGIKGCGVIPVYGLEHSLGLGGRSCSTAQIVELQVSDESDQHSEMDINELQHRRSTDENEEDQQQQLIPPNEKEDDLNDKSCCACSIGLLLKHLVEEAKRYFS